MSKEVWLLIVDRFYVIVIDTFGECRYVLFGICLAAGELSR